MDDGLPPQVQQRSAQVLGRRGRGGQIAGYRAGITMSQRRPISVR